MIAAVLSLRGLSKSYGDSSKRVVLRDISFDLAAGEYVAVMGESGVGKSTLLNLIAGLEQPDSGEVLLGGVELSSLHDDVRTRLRAQRMGFVFQAFHILPYLNVLQNVELALRLQPQPQHDSRERSLLMLRAVGLAERAQSMPRELSGGESQRVAIARALVHHPQLVLADEPTGNLDPDTAVQVLELLRDQVKAGQAAGILVTHSRVAAQMTDRVYLLTRDGLRAA